MKKSLILGAAALAAAAWAPIADAGEVKMGGYYMGRWQAYDANTTKEASSADNGERYVHRLQLNLDMSASEKSHAHMRVRVLDSAVMEGAELGVASDLGLANNQVSGTTVSDLWEIRQIWLETEAWGIGVKYGEMPISLNDNILVGDDLSSNAGLLLSKTFGDVTAVLANIRINEGNMAGGSVNNGYATTATALAASSLVNGVITTPAVDTTQNGSNEDDANLFAGALFGKAGIVNYNLTMAYADLGKDSTFKNVLTAVAPTDFPVNSDSNNLWLGLTLSGKLGAVDAVGTVLYEDGYDSSTNRKSSVTDSGWLGALRLKGQTGFGEWNGYSFYASSDFNNITSDNMVWSPTWDMGGVGGIDLISTFANANGALVSSPSENMWGVGFGLTLMASGWTIRPSIDYAGVVDNTINVVSNTPSNVKYDSAVGSSLLLSTKIQEATTFALEGGIVSPDATSFATSEDDITFVQAGIKMDF